LIRQDPVQITYVLSNAPADISLETMAWRKTQRYPIERSNQDAKDELGWDEFQTPANISLGTPIGFNDPGLLVRSRYAPPATIRNGHGDN